MPTRTTLGKIGNIGYGVLKEVPALAVVAGALDYLDAAITAAQTTLNLIDTSRFPSSGTIGIDAEDITYTGKSATQLTGLTRGVNSTTAVIHGRGVPVWEERTDFTYEAFSHPIKQFDNIYAVGNNTKLKITSIVTNYTGNTGSQHPTWPNKAMIVVPSKITKEQAVGLLVSDGITVVDAIAVVDSITVNDGISISDLIQVLDNLGVSTGSHSHSTTASTQTLTPTSAQSLNNNNVQFTGVVGNVYDESEITSFRVATNNLLASSNGTIRVFFPSYSGPTPTGIKICILHGSSVDGGTTSVNYVKFDGVNLNDTGVQVTQNLQEQQFQRN